MTNLIENAMKLLNGGLLPADLTNIYIFIKILSFVLLVAISSFGIGFYLGLSARGVIQ